MPKKSSLNPFRLLADGWTFLWKQPALVHVLVWFLILPVIVIDVLTAYWPVSEAQSIQNIGQVGYVLAGIIYTVIVFWGFASILLVARRMVINRAGRSRTSFRSVRRESARLILPLFFTSLLRSVVTLEWAFIALVPAALFVLGAQTCRAEISPLISAIGVFLNTGTREQLFAVLPSVFSRCSPTLLAIPLLIPALIYQLQTVFYGVVLASENLRYRDALHKSRLIIRGRFWRTILIICILGVSLFVPAFVVSAIVAALQTAFAPSLPIISATVNDALSAFAGMLFTLALVAFYGKLRKAAGRVEEVVPELEE